MAYKSRRRASTGKTRSRFRCLELFTYLTKDAQKRAFAIVGASEMAALDVHSFQKQPAVLRRRRLEQPVCAVVESARTGEKDLNPLRRLVSTQPPQVQAELHATFDDKIELIGYDIPQEAQRGTEFIVRLHYRVFGAGARQLPGVFALRWIKRTHQRRSHPARWQIPDQLLDLRPVHHRRVPHEHLASKPERRVLYGVYWLLAAGMEHG